MLDIKFRAWDGRKIFNVDVLGISKCTWACPDYGTRGVSLAYQPHIEIMQYIGAKDKFGNDVYEGDIIYHPEGVIAEVYYDVKRCAFLTKFKDGGDDELNYISRVILGEGCRVIGNIYENPEWAVDN